MGGGEGAELLVSLLVALLCTLLSSGLATAKTTRNITAFDWPGEPKFATVGGAHGWNPALNNSFFQAWANGALIKATLGHVLVFQSSSASERTVNVLATTDRSLSRTSICGNANLTSYYGTNHFSSNVSLQPLQPDRTYWFVSGGAGDCLSGMVFSVFFKRSKVSTPPVQREVGVVYNAVYRDTRGMIISSFGPFVPEQPVPAALNSKDARRRFANGDAVVFAVYGYNSIFLRSEIGDPDTCHDFPVTWTLKDGDNNRTDQDYWGIYLTDIGALRNCDCVGELAGLVSISGGSSLIDCSWEQPVARMLLRNVTSTEMCSKNPGPPYLCSAARPRLPLLPSGWLITASAVLLLFQL